MALLVGADPEVFAMREGKLVSAWGMVPGTKEEPFPVNRGAVQVDGMALEFNIDPAATEDEFVLNLNEVMAQLRQMAGVDLAALPVAEFGEEYIEAQPEKAKELGCDPDYNAWTGQQNPVPDVNLPFRTGAGHVHLGWLRDIIPHNHDEVCKMVTQQLDFYLGLPSLLFDNDNKRRQMYGQPGSYRPKPYGVEYRVLSNKWLESDTLKRWVFRNTHAAFRSVKKNNLADRWGNPSRVFRDNDINLAKVICEEEGIEIPEVQDVG